VERTLADKFRSLAAELNHEADTAGDTNEDANYANAQRDIAFAIRVVLGDAVPHRPFIDWRQRAEAAEARVATLEAALRQLIENLKERPWLGRTPREIVAMIEAALAAKEQAK
jgi:hypothetical protein